MWAVELRRVVVLLLQIRLRVRRRGPLGVVHRAVGRRAADEARELRLAGVPQDVHQEQAILGVRVARAEHRVGAGDAVDVRHAELVVAHDRHAGFRRGRRLDVARLDAEGRVLEVLLHLLHAEAALRAGVDQALVEFLLVVPMRRQRAVQRVLGELHRVVRARLAGRQHVAEPAGVVLAVRRGVGREGRGRPEREQRDGTREGAERQSCPGDPVHPTPRKRRAAILSASTKRRAGSRRLVLRRQVEGRLPRTSAFDLRLSVIRHGLQRAGRVVGA